MIDKVRDGGKPASRNRPCPRQPLVLMQRGLRVVVAAVAAHPSDRLHLNQPLLWRKVMVPCGETPAKLNLHRRRRRRGRRVKRKSPHQLHHHHHHHRRQRHQPSRLFCCQRNNKMELPHRHRRHRRHHHPQRPSHPKSNRLHKQNHHRHHLNQKRALFVPNRKLRLLFLLCLRPHSLRRVR